MSALSVSTEGRIQFAVKKNPWRNQKTPTGKENTNTKRTLPTKEESGGSPPKQRLSRVLSPVADIDNGAVVAPAPVDTTSPIKMLQVRKALPSPPSRPSDTSTNCTISKCGSDVGDDFGTNLPGRDDKVRELTSFVLAHLEAGTCGSAYVSGPPGTGKTATLKSITSHPKVSSGYRIVYINCTGMRCSSAVYAEIAKRLGVRPAGSTRSEKSYLAAIENYLASSHKMILLVLDEMDQLESRNQSVLYTVFSWTTGDSGLVLIGVANALDLTDRLLPRIATRGGVQPLLVHFPPYTRNQIIDIVRTVLLSQGDSKKGVTFGRGAVELLASKVSSVSGDARRAIDITRRTIDVALVDKHMGDAVVSMQDVLRVVNSAYATSQTLVSSGLLGAADSQGSASGGADSCFPLQQKLLVCSLLLIRHNSPKSKEVTVGMLHQVYQRVCERRNLSAVDLSEFVSLVELVEARGVMKIVGKTKNRLAKVMMQWDEKEVSNALQDKQLLADVLNDVTCLPK